MPSAAGSPFGFEAVEIRQLLPRFSGNSRAAVAFRARNVFFLFAEEIDRQMTVVSASAADGGGGTVSKAFHLRTVKQRRGFFPRGFGIEGSPIGAHQSGDCGADDMASEQRLKAAQHRVVAEGAALNDDFLSELVG